MSLSRVRQFLIGAIGLFYVCLVYFLFLDLRHSRWLIEMHNQECEPMFISFFVALGVFLLIAARRPIEHRGVIAFAAWQSLFHSTVMAVMTVQAKLNGTPRQMVDVLFTAVLGVVLLALIPRKQQLPQPETGPLAT